MADRVAIVTAGGSSMGAAAARCLTADGYRVAILSSAGKGEAPVAEPGGFGVIGSNRSTDTFAADNVRMNNVLPGWIDSLPATAKRCQACLSVATAKPRRWPPPSLGRASGSTAVSRNPSDLPPARRRPARTRNTPLHP